MAFYKLTWIAVLLQSAICTASQAIEDCNYDDTQFSAIVAFGDSFTDNGAHEMFLEYLESQSLSSFDREWVLDFVKQNLASESPLVSPKYLKWTLWVGVEFRVTKRAFSYKGRFSNGPVWIDYVAANLSIPLINYAVGGATTSSSLVQGYTGPNSSIPVPSIDQQVATFLRNPPSEVSTDNLLFVLYGGANDILFNPNITATQSFREIMASQSVLSSRFPNATILILDYPDLSRIPYAFYIKWIDKRELHAFSQGLSALYRQSVYEDTFNGPSQLVYVELPELFNRWDYYAEPQDYGFEPLGSYGSCLVGVYQETSNVSLCSMPDAKVFWDEYHPTSHAHSFVAKKVLDTLQTYSMRVKRR